ncbi:hypothetical protein SpCBS45565_g06147 [Spizellomyces sp. 'palustris']|nr:hypothetical protein SpCBS45565_g06147 [Spizellomyces sp. 'palustris']
MHFSRCRSLHLPFLSSLLSSRPAVCPVPVTRAQTHQATDTVDDHTANVNHQGKSSDAHGMRDPASGSRRYDTRFAKGRELTDASKPRGSSSLGQLSQLQPLGDTPVICPLCLNATKARDLDRHIDSGCTSFATRIGEPSAQSWSAAAINRRDSRRPKASVPYSLYNESKLRKLLRDDGLPSGGDRSTLIKRHAEWVKRYNANLDHPQPKSDFQVSRELAEWEKAMTSILPTPFTSIPGHEVTVETEEEKRKHHERYKAEYERMIVGLKKRKRGEESSTPSDSTHQVTADQHTFYEL